MSKTKNFRSIILDKIQKMTILIMKAPSLRYAHIKQRGLATVCDKEDGQLSMTMFTAPPA